MNIQYKKLKDFIGSKIIYLFVVSLFVGAVLFCCELAFPFGIRLFLSKIGLVSDDRIRFWDQINEITLIQVTFLLSGISIVRGGFQWLQFYLQGVIAEEFKFRVRNKLINTVYKGFSNNSSESFSIFSEYSNNAAMFFTFVGATMTNCLISSLLLIAMFKVEDMLTLYILSGALALGGLLYLLSTSLKFQGQENQSTWKKASQRLGMSLRNLPLVKIYGMEETEKKTATTHLKILKENTIKSVVMSGSLQSVPQVLGMSLIFFILVKGGFTEKIGPGTLLAYIFLTFRFFTFSSFVSQSSAQALVKLNYFKELYDWWHGENKYKIENKKPSQSTVKRIHKLNLDSNEYLYGWKVKNLYFSYFGGRCTAIDNLNFNIDPGSVFTITGESGTGKTSLLYLLLGLIKPDNGLVELSYAKKLFQVNTLEKSFLRDIGYVGPESFLIEGTALENLMYGNGKRVDSTRIAQVIEQADCGFLYDTSYGLSHKLTEQGMGLSAGQKQRIALARALLREPKALILDEATSNVDEETEERLINTFKTLKGNITIVIITHRKELLRISDSHLHLQLGKPSVKMKESA